ncbi:hypothetical protein ACTWPB_22785 [Nocardia sp. IBHARD005]|uniref:hypothetical protein n=1 Tax=Nocardia sp. IBHARD005 TaxID=3457765 RepID=UPI004058F7C9
MATGLTMPNGLAQLPNGDFVVSSDMRGHADPCDTSALNSALSTINRLVIVPEIVDTAGRQSANG